MKIFITGANGLVGTSLGRFLLSEGHEVTGLVRSEAKGRLLPAGETYVLGEGTRAGAWQDAVAGRDVLINLAGVPIFKRWTAAYKQLLRDTRIITTRNLVDAIPTETGSSVTLLSTSAVGYYGFTGDEELDEAAPPGNDFLALLARDWEAEAVRAREKGVRVVLSRFGIVLGKDGGALPQMILPFRLFVGGPLGSGRQWFSWIHIQDLCRAAGFVIANSEIKGPINFTAPVPARNKDLAKAVGKVLRRPSIMPAPSFMIRLLMGEFGAVVLKGQRVVPHALQTQGFEFKFPDIEAALRNLLIP